MRVLWIIGSVLVVMGAVQAWHKKAPKMRAKTSAEHTLPRSSLYQSAGSYELHIDRRFVRAGRIQYLMWFRSDEPRAPLYSI